MNKVLGIKNANKLVPLKDDDDRKPRDPVSENMAILMGKPVKAFMIQDHEAHLAVHMTAMQDPKIAEIVGQNPAAQALIEKRGFVAVREVASVTPSLNINSDGSGRAQARGLGVCAERRQHGRLGI